MKAPPRSARAEVVATELLDELDLTANATISALDPSFAGNCRPLPGEVSRGAVFGELGALSGRWGAEGVGAVRVAGHDQHLRGGPSPAPRSRGTGGRHVVIAKIVELLKASLHWT